MVLNEDVDALLASLVDDVLVMSQLLNSGLGDEDVDATLNSVQGDRVVAGVRSEDSDGIAGGKAVDGGLVGIGILLVVGRERLEGGV